MFTLADLPVRPVRIFMFLSLYCLYYSFDILRSMGFAVDEPTLIGVFVKVLVQQQCLLSLKQHHEVAKMLQCELNHSPQISFKDCSILFLLLCTVDLRCGMHTTTVPQEPVLHLCVLQKAFISNWHLFPSPTSKVHQYLPATPLCPFSQMT